MQRTSSTLFGVPRMIGFVLAATLVVALVWATAAQAQTPAEDQYGGPKVEASGAQAGSGSSGGGQGGGQGGSGSGGQSGALPATGGPMLLLYAGALVASGAGLVLLRYRSGRER